MSCRKKIAVRLAFLAMVLGWAVQLLLTHQVGQPYPALQMPAFAGSAGYRAGAVHIPRLEAVFTCDEGSVVCGQRELLGKIPDGMHTVIAKNVLRPPELEESSVSSAYLLFWRRVFPGMYAGAMNRQGGKIPPCFRAWLAQRGRELAPGRHVRRVELAWFEEVIPFRHEPYHDTKARFLGSFSIPLEPSPETPG